MNYKIPTWNIIYMKLTDQTRLVACQKSKSFDINLKAAAKLIFMKSFWFSQY